MQALIDWFISRIGLLLSWLNTVPIVEGVSLLGVLVSALIVALLIHNFLYRAG